MFLAALAPRPPDARGWSVSSARIHVPSTLAPFPTLVCEPHASDPLPTLLEWLAPASSTPARRRLYQAARKIRPRLVHNSTVRPVPPPHTAGGAPATPPRIGGHGLALLALMDTNAARSALATWNTRMQHIFETDETFRTYAYNICVKHMQHPDKQLQHEKTLTAT
jgi:hypothetical protein